MKNLPTMQKTPVNNIQNYMPPQMQDAGARMPINNKKILQNISINCVFPYLVKDTQEWVAYFTTNI